MLTSETSPRGNIVAITRLLEQFNDENIARFKQYLFEQMGISNDQQLLCKVLPVIQKSLLSSQTIESLKHKAIEIAEKQLMPFKVVKQAVVNKLTITDTSNNYNYNNHVTIYKAIENGYNDNDRLSRLPSEIIGHIGSYLNKKDSIGIGTLNRQLYIESQKMSYVWKRCNDSFGINRNILDRLSHNISNPFISYLPSTLILQQFISLNTSHSRYDSLLASQWFENLFTRLNYLSMHESYFSYLPLNKLFKSSK